MSFGWDEGGGDEPTPGKKKRAPLRKPFRRGAKGIGHRRRLLDCDQGDVVRFLGGPPGLDLGMVAPSSSGRLSFVVAGTAMVRFLTGDGLTEPLPVSGNPRVVRLEGYR